MRAPAVVVAGCLALVVVPAGSGSPQHGSIERAPDLQQVVERLVAGGAPGALAIVRTPTGVHRAAAGFASLNPKVPLRPTDRFRIASVTKTFVAALVLRLQAEHRLGLEDSVERWLPHTVPHGTAITVRELLNHTSGLFDYDDDSTWVNARISKPGRQWSPRELISIANSHRPLFEPGTNWSYSNTNYVLLGLVVEAATKTSLAEALQSRLFRPLSLSSTSYPPGTAIEGRYAHGYFVSRPPLPYRAGTLIDISTILSPSGWGAGQMLSNADDLTRFFAALLGGRVLPAAQLKAMKNEVLPHRYGLGLRITNTSCGKAFGHNGDFPGYRNTVWATADGRRVISVMVNIDETGVPWNTLESAAKSALCSG